MGHTFEADFLMYQSPKLTRLYSPLTPSCIIVVGHTTRFTYASVTKVGQTLQPIDSLMYHFIGTHFELDYLLHWSLKLDTLYRLLTLMYHLWGTPDSLMHESPKSATLYSPLTLSCITSGTHIWTWFSMPKSPKLATLYNLLTLSRITVVGHTFELNSLMHQHQSWSHLTSRWLSCITEPGHTLEPIDSYAKWGSHLNLSTLLCV